MDGYNSSEFGSDDEETEFGLYARLYFEPNEDVPAGLSESHLGNIISPLMGNEREVRSPNKTPASKSSQKNITLLPSSVAEKDASKDRNEINSRSEININKAKSLVVDNTVSVQAENMVDITKTKTRKAQSVMRRERHSSVCSIDSISGSVALDNLYCHSLDSVEEEEETLTDTLIDKSVHDTLRSSNKRSKKRKKVASSSEMSELEDSRCRNFEHISCGRNKKELKKEKVMSSIIYISSSSDLSGHEKGKNSQKTVHESLNFDYTRINGKRKKKKKKRKLEEKVYDIFSSDSSDSSVLSQQPQKIQRVNCMINDRTVNKNNNRNDSKVSVSFVNDTPGVLGTKDFNPKIGSLEKPKKSKQIFTDSESESSDIECLDKQELHKTKLTMNFLDNVTVCMGDSPFNFNVSITPRKSLTEQLPSFSKFSLDYTKRRSPSKKTSSCKHWTRDMVSFYDSDVSEEFDVEDIHSQQSNRGWEIDKADYQIFSRGRYYNRREDRCNRCRQFGHRIESCLKIPCCHICSATDHTIVRDCPSFCCLWCGGPPHRYHECKNSSAHCQICGIDGHREDGCPDLWRRYHITLSGTTPICPSSPPCVKKRVYCYNCAKAGHYGHNCPLKLAPDVKQRYPLLSQEIYSYSEPVVNVNGSLMINMEYLQGNKETEMSFMNSEPDIFGKNSQDRKPSKLLKHLVRCKKKLEVMKIVRKRIRYFSLMRKQLKNLPAAVAVLREGKKYLSTTGIPSPEFSERLEKSLQIAAEIVLGYLKKGEGRDILNHIHQLLYRVEKLSRNDSVPYYMLEDFAQTFGKIYNPRLGKLDEILHLAETYLQSIGTHLETVSHEQACFKDLQLSSIDKMQHMKYVCKDNMQENRPKDIFDLTVDDVGSSKMARNIGMKYTNVEMKEKYICSGNALNGYLTGENSHELDEVCSYIKALKSRKAFIKNVTKEKVSRKMKAFLLRTGVEVSNEKSKSIKKKKLRVNEVEYNVIKAKEIKEKQPEENAFVGNKEHVMVNVSKAKVQKKKKGKKDDTLVVKKKKQLKKRKSSFRKKISASTVSALNGTINSSEPKLKYHNKNNK